MATDIPLIDLDDIHLKLRSDAGFVNILRGIDLKIPAGETVSIVGPSGSGKTTLMMVLGGLERPTEGTVSVGGRVLNDLGEDELALFRRDTVGIVFQDFHLVPTMTALENVAIPLEFAGSADAFEKAGEALRAVGLGDRLHHYPGQLSGGEQQRTAIARAFVAEPKLLLADEPTGNLDHDTGLKVIDLMFELAKDKGATLVMVTHDRELAGRCGRVVSLVDGRIEQEDGADAA